MTASNVVTIIILWTLLLGLGAALLNAYAVWPFNDDTTQDDEERGNKSSPVRDGFNETDPVTDKTVDDTGGSWARLLAWTVLFLFVVAGIGVAGAYLFGTQTDGPAWTREDAVRNTQEHLESHAGLERATEARHNQVWYDYEYFSGMRTPQSEDRHCILAYYTTQSGSQYKPSHDTHTYLCNLDKGRIAAHVTGYTLSEAQDEFKIRLEKSESPTGGTPDAV